VIPAVDARSKHSGEPARKRLMRGVGDDGAMPTLVVGVVTMARAQLLDLATFIQMVDRVGPHAEANPLVAFLFSTHGLPVLAVVKVALLAFLTAIVAALAGKPAIRLAVPVTVVVLTVAIAAGLIGGATNTAAIGLL
jgi:hypothetical protein